MHSYCCNSFCCALGNKLKLWNINRPCGLMDEELPRDERFIFTGVITARIRRNGEIIVSLCLSVHTPGRVPPSLDRGVPPSNLGCEVSKAGWGYPPPCPRLDGVPPSGPGPGMGYSLPIWIWTWDGQDNRRSTRYAEGGMPLAFKRDDSLVFYYFWRQIYFKFQIFESRKMKSSRNHDLADCTVANCNC